MIPISAAEWNRLADVETIVRCEATSYRGPRDYLDDCRGCGAPFWANGSGGRRQVYCTPGCRQLHLNRACKRRKRAIPPERWRVGVAQDAA